MKKSIFTRFLAIFTLVISIFTLNGCGGSGGGSTPSNTPVTTKPVASFSASALSGTAPLSVTFTDTSINTPTSWSWNFGDGATSTSQNPTHIFLAAGTYAVTMSATNSVGTSTLPATATITVNAPPITVTKLITNGGGLAAGKDGAGNNYFAIEKGGSVRIAKYDANNNIQWGGIQPLLISTQASDSYYCNKLLFPASDATFFYAICTKELPLFIGFRSQGIVSLIKIRKDTGAVAGTIQLASIGFFTAVDMIPTESRFYVVDGGCVFRRYAFDGTSDASFTLGISYGMTSMSVTATNVFTYGTKNDITGSKSHPTVLMFPKDLSTESEASYNLSPTLDRTSSNSMTITSQGIFSLATLDVFSANNNVLVKWDVATGTPTLIKSYGTLQFQQLTSDTAGNLYASTNQSTYKLSPTTGIVQWTTPAPTDGTSLDLAVIDNTTGNLFVTFSTAFIHTVGYISIFDSTTGIQK